MLGLDAYDSSSEDEAQPTSSTRAQVREPTLRYVKPYVG